MRRNKLWRDQLLIIILPSKAKSCSEKDILLCKKLKHFSGVDIMFGMFHHGFSTSVLPFQITYILK